MENMGISLAIDDYQFPIMSLETIKTTDLIIHLMYHSAINTFKLISSLQVINDMLPVLARREVDRLIAELQDAQFKLEFGPATTIEFVNTLNFLDDIQVRVRKID